MKIFGKILYITAIALLLIAIASLIFAISVQSITLKYVLAGFSFLSGIISWSFQKMSEWLEKKSMKGERS